MGESCILIRPYKALKLLESCLQGCQVPECTLSRPISFSCSLLDISCSRVSPTPFILLPLCLLPCLASADSPLSTCPLFLLCPFSLHFPVSLPDSWRRHVVYLTQNRTPLLFQRVEPPSPAQDGGPGLNNALPPPETTETVNSL